MEENEISGRLKAIFENLDSSANSSRIVFWLDPSKEFEDVIDRISVDGVSILTWDGYNAFEIKYKVEAESPDSKFLIYAPGEFPSDKDNILADMMFYSKPYFSADKVTCLRDELGLGESCSQLLKDHISFFNSNERKKKLLKLEPGLNDPIEVTCAMLAVVLDQKSINFEDITKSIIVQSSDDIIDNSEEIMCRLDKYGLIKDFWFLCEEQFGYSGNYVPEFFTNLFVTAAIKGTSLESISKLSAHLLTNSNHVISFVNHVLNDSSTSTEIQEVVRYIQNKIKFDKFLESLNNEDVATVGVFPCVDECLFNRLSKQICSTHSQLDNGSLELIESRMFKSSYDFIDEYNTLISASKMIGLCSLFSVSVEDLTSADSILCSYVEKWYEIDYMYRHFVFYSDKVDSDLIIELKEFIDNEYLNTFLNPIVSKLCSSVSNYSDLPEPYQMKFCDKFLDTSRNTVVIISDAFRYECAVELSKILGKTSRVKDQSLKHVISTLPSITSYGMAALLPNSGIKVSKDGIVTIDNRSTATLDAREIILQSKYPDSIVLNYTQFKTKSSTALRELCKGKRLIYIYHNCIDTEGESSPSENKTFDACDQAIKEIIGVINKVTNWNYTKFIVTADHGFIYRRNPITEFEKIDTVSGFDASRRYAVNSRSYRLKQSLEFSLDYLDDSNEGMFVSVPSSASVFKQPGSGMNYVHGGLSPQEVVVPILTVYTNKGAVSEKYVGLGVIQEKEIKQVNPRFTFIQEHPVSDEYRGAQYEVWLEDEDRNKVSDSLTIDADRSENDSFEFRKKFSEQLKSEYVYLMIKNLSDPLEELREYKFKVKLMFDIII